MRTVSMPMVVLLPAFLSAMLLTFQLPRMPSPDLTRIALLVWVVLAGFGLSMSARKANDRWRGQAGRNARFSWILLLLLAVLLSLERGGRWQQGVLMEVCERLPLTLDGVVEGLPQHIDSDHGAIVRLELRVVNLWPETCAGPERVRVYRYLDGGDDPVLRAGDGVHIAVRLRKPWGSVNPHAREGERRYLLQGIHAVGSASKLLSHDTSRSLTVLERIHRLRSELSAAMRANRPLEEGALLAALAVGDRRFLRTQDWERLRRFGLTHLLVISGLHVSLVAIGGWWLGRLLALFLLLVPGASYGGRIGRAVGAATALLCASVYALLAGFTLPTQRALLMLLLVLTPTVLGRSVAPVTLVPVTALLLAIFDPVSVLGASYWLSLGAVGLLCWFGQWTGAMGKFRRAINGQGFMVLAMAPLSLYWFGGMASAGAVINLVAVPLVSWLVLPLLLVGSVLLLLWSWAGHALIDGAGFLLGQSWAFLETLDASNPVFSGLALMPSWPQLLALLAALLLLVMPPFLGRRRTLIVLLLASLGGNDERDTAAEVLVFDVGQGTAVLVQSGGQRLLYDTGGVSGGVAKAESAILPWFRARRRYELDWLVISHPDLDHSGGETLIRDALAPSRLRRGRAVTPDEEGVCRLGERHRLGPRVEVQVLSQAYRTDSDNNASCVVLLHLAGLRLLLPGDIDEKRERDLVAYWGRSLHAQFLLAAHHGSASSSSRLWLRTVNPDVALITAGRGNAFGHPSGVVVDALAARGTQVLSTAFSGALHFRIAADGSIRCRRSRHRYSPFWRAGTGSPDCSLQQHSST